MMRLLSHPASPYGRKVRIAMALNLVLELLEKSRGRR